MDQLTFDGPTEEEHQQELDMLHDDLDVFVGVFGYDVVLATLKLFAPSPDHPVPSAPARWTDPVTSQLSAKREQDVRRFSSKSRQSKLLTVFASGPRTDQEATIRVVGTHASPSSFDGCRRRCSDLRAAGYLADTGKRRHNIGSDDEAIVWQVTEAGWKALASLNSTGWSL